MTIQEELRIIFRKGERYTNKQIKATLRYFYEIFGISGKAKASDLKLFGFCVKRALIRDGNKRIEGLEII